MKKTILLLFLFIIPWCVFADNTTATPINLEHTHKGEPRSGFPMYPDVPTAFYCYNDKSQWIIIDGGGAVSYYDVEISSPVTNYVEISTQVDGTYDTIDITSLAPGAHVITIESPSGNIYEGTFISY